jgi:RNA-splicing ligase RtcB
MEIIGEYNTATVFTDNIELSAIHQITEICNLEFLKNSNIRIMPDAHAGTGCVIGTTMTITDKIIPNLVGVDIGCGMEVAVLSERNLDLEKLDEVIHEFIPAGFDIRKQSHDYIHQIDLNQLICKEYLNLERAKLSLGTLGGGNHFIEVDRDNNNKLYIVIHSGSRHLGKQVADYYQKLAFQELVSKDIKIDKDLAYLEGTTFEDYFHDMKIVQEYAKLNRKAIIDEIITRMGFHVLDSFTTIHNYIDTDNMILRKGAISARKGEIVIIPINMRDGSIIAIGKGNPSWNYSAPHGAGRIMSRKQAKEKVKLNDFVKSMDGIYSTTVNLSTLDESPMAYKPLEEIVNNIQDTVVVTNVIKPVYNFKH